MRLIDANELMEHVWRDRLDSREAIAEMVNNAPTVRNAIWISVKDRLPEEDGEYLISMYHRFMIGGIYKKYTGRFVAKYYAEYKEWRIMNDVCTSVTHWMPLPELPESEDDAE